MATDIKLNIIQKCFQTFEFDDFDELNTHVNDNFDEQITRIADEVIHDYLHIVDGEFSFVMSDKLVNTIRGKRKSIYTSHDNGEERKFADTFKFGQKMLHIRNGFKEPESVLTSVLHEMEYMNRPMIYGIRRQVLEFLPANRKLQETMTMFLDSISHEISMRTGGYYLKRHHNRDEYEENLSFREKQELESRIFDFTQKRKTMIIQERLLASSFFSKLDTLIDVIHNHFLAVGYDIHGGCIEYQVGYNIGW